MTLLCFTLHLRDFSFHQGLSGCGWPSGRNRMPIDLPGPPWLVPPRMGFGHPPSVFWFPHLYSQLLFDSLMPSPSPLVHRFPCSDDEIGTSRHDSLVNHNPDQMCVDRRKRRVLCPSGSLPDRFLVFRVFSSALLPGFSGPESSVISVDLPPSGPLPLQGLFIGSVLWRLVQLSAPGQEGFPG